MHITLATTLPSLIENARIEEEVKAMGHTFKLLDLQDFNFDIDKGKLKIPEIDNLKTDLVIVRGIFNSIKTISVIIADLRSQGIRVFDNNFLEHRYSIDKVTDLVKLTLKGIAVPRTMYVRDFADYASAAIKIGYPVVVKSSRMGKGASVYKINSTDELTTFITQKIKEEKNAKSYILQEFIPYVHDLRVLIIGDNSYIMKRIPASGEFRANFSLGGSVELYDLDSKGRMLAKEALAAVNMTVGGVDVLITADDKRYILEVNHTAGFVGMEKATGKNIGRLFVEHAIANAK